MALSLKSVIVAGMLALSFTCTGFASDHYFDYLYNDINYPRVDARQGVGSYVDLTSLYLIKNDQFGVEFKVNVLAVNHNATNCREPKIYTFHFFKNYSEPNSIFYSAHKKGNGTSVSWKKEDLNNTIGAFLAINRTFKKCMEHITDTPYYY